MSKFKNKIINSIVREPYIHFLLIGSLLYLYYQNYHITPVVQTKENIVISSMEIEDINRMTKILWERDLRPSELDAILKATYFDKILLNEAIGLELEKKDSEIRTKLISKMKQILTPTIEEPSEELLHKYYLQNIKDYSITSKISFYHIYLNNIAKIDIKSFVKMLNINAIEAKNASNYGDNYSLGNQILSIDKAQLSKKFGKYFSEQVWKLSSKRWHKVIRSSYGYHILYITKKETTHPYPFNDIEDRVYSDFMLKQKEDNTLSAYKKLSTQYSLKIKYSL